MLLLSHLEEILGVHAARLTGQAHAHKGHSRACAGVGGRRLHGFALRAYEMCRRTSGIHEGRIALQLLDHLFVLLVGLHAGNTEGDDLHTAEITPLARQLLVEGVGQLKRMTGESGIADAHFADLCKRGLKRGQQLRLHLTRDIFSLIVLADIAAYVGVKQQRILQSDAVLAEAADADVYVDAGPLIHHPERNGAGRTVLIARQLLGVEVVDALILGGLAAEGKALADVHKYVLYVFAQIAEEDARLCGHIVGVFARLGAHIHHLALLHDKHTLTVGNGDHAAVGDDVVITLGVAGTARDLLSSLNRQHIRGDGFAIKVFPPLVGHNAAGRA